MRLYRSESRDEEDDEDNVAQIHIKYILHDPMSTSPHPHRHPALVMNEMSGLERHLSMNEDSFFHHQYHILALRHHFFFCVIHPLRQYSIATCSIILSEGCQRTHTKYDVDDEEG